MDDKLSVRKLELNLRPPEEYVFHVHSHGNTDLQTLKLDGVSSKQDTKIQNSSATSRQNNFKSPGQRQFNTKSTQNNSCMYQTHSICTCIHKCDKGHNEIRTDTLASLNSDVIKLGAPARIFNNNGVVHRETQEKATEEMKKPVQIKRNSSFYNVVSMTGSCFGFGKKPMD